MKTPDLLMFEKHIGEFEFQNGIDLGMWGFHSDDPTLSWPHVTIWVQTSANYYKPEKCYLKFTLDNYPYSPPSACPWDIINNRILANENWPSGSVALNAVFKPGWKNIALYAPFDRVPISDHANWATQYPEYWWRSSFKVTDYLLFIHSLLNT